VDRQLHEAGSSFYRRFTVVCVCGGGVSPWYGDDLGRRARTGRMADEPAGIGTIRDRSVRHVARGFRGVLGHVRPGKGAWCLGKVR
jgi:hypothetical protein